MGKMSPQAAIRILAQAKVEKTPGNANQVNYDRARRLAIAALKVYHVPGKEGGNRMTEEKAKALVERLGKLQEDGGAAGLPCPRCGHDRMDPVMIRNALSRRAKVYICSVCGTDEALMDAAGKPPVPFSEWGMALGFAEEDDADE